MTFDLRREWPAVLAIIAMIIATLIVYPQLPDPMPTHWNASGQVDDYSSRLVGAWIMPLTAIGIYGLLLLLPRIDPRRANIARFSDVYRLVRVATVLFMVMMQFAIIYAVLSGNESVITRVTPVAVGILFILIGNYMPRVRSNWFMGVRTPWTLSSDRVWRNTHRLAGRLFVAIGLLFILAIFFPVEWFVWIILGSVLVLLVVLVGYSWWDYQREAQPEH